MTISPATTPLYSFNLWHQPWIRVTRPDGTATELGLGECLAQAHRLYALHDPSPLVVGGIHRLLTAILQAIYAPESLDDIDAIWASNQFDLTRLADFAAQHSERFDLFHPTAPFLQTGDVPLGGWRNPEKSSDLTTIARLFAEVPSASNRTLFHHVTDQAHQVCPACCAQALIAMPAFARVEGGGKEGYKPSINGLPPVYVLPVGKTLFQSLALSLTGVNYRSKAADTARDGITPWTKEPTIPHKHEVGAVGYIESLLFPSRRIRLYPLDEPAYCTQCGEHSPIIVHQMYFKMGMSRKKDARVWDDPFVSLRAPTAKGKKDAPTPVRLQPGKAIWREYSTLFLSYEEKAEQRPHIVRQTEALVDRGFLQDMQQIRFRCVGVRTASDAKVFEWFDEALDVPPALLTDPDGTLAVEDALQRAEGAEKGLTLVFSRHFRPERERDKPIKKDLVRFQTLYARMRAMFWERLAPAFFAFVRDAADPEQREAVERRWIDTLVRVGISTFNETADLVGDRADALQARVEAQADCRRQLYKARKEWIGDD